VKWVVPAASERRAVVLCGGGNNGGDGYVVARHLTNAGMECVIYAAVEPRSLKGDARVQADIADRMGVPIEPITDQAALSSCAQQWKNSNVSVDALLGTGFRGDVRPEMARVIEACNEARRATTNRGIVVAVDVPSGLDCDTGQAGNPTVKADITVTFVARKIGFKAPEARPYLGRVVVAGIGTPPSLIDRVRHEVV
jgi:NAD(P)H-hydrate epimerase